jgi:hypothetical protein
MERHRRLQPHVQKLLGPIEISRCEEQHMYQRVTGNPLTDDLNSLDFLPQSRRNDLLTELYCVLSGSHLGINKILNKVRQRYWLQAKYRY